jgi:hypothetical protein
MKNKNLRSWNVSTERYEIMPCCGTVHKRLVSIAAQVRWAIQLLNVSRAFYTVDVFRFHTCVQVLQNGLISGIMKHCDKRAHIILVALIYLQVYFRNTSGKYNMQSTCQQWWICPQSRVPERLRSLKRIFDSTFFISSLKILVLCSFNVSLSIWEDIGR